MDIWKEGKYLDLWSVPHLLSGVIFTGWLLVLGLNISTIFFLHLVIAIIWEIIEASKEIHEHLGNKVVDVIVGNAGFFLVYIFSISFKVLMILTLLYIFLAFCGYLAHRKRISQNKVELV